MMTRYKQLLTYIKSAVTRNHSEKSINSILDYISTSKNVRNSFFVIIRSTFYKSNAILPASNSFSHKIQNPLKIILLCRENVPTVGSVTKRFKYAINIEEIVFKVI